MQEDSSCLAVWLPTVPADVRRATRKLNRPSPASHPPGAHLNRPDARYGIPLTCAAHLNSRFFFS